MEAPKWKIMDAKGTKEQEAVWVRRQERRAAPELAAATIDRILKRNGTR